MAKARKAAKARKVAEPKTQAERFLEAAKKARIDQSGSMFSQAMGKITMARNARKSTRMG